MKSIKATLYYPDSEEALTHFYLDQGMSFFEYLAKHGVDEDRRSYWIVYNKAWAVEEVTLKLMSDRLPVMVIIFTSRAIIDNKVIIAPFRTTWAREKLFEGFGILEGQEELIEELRLCPKYARIIYSNIN
jgi:hypothetical protein